MYVDNLALFAGFTAGLQAIFNIDSAYAMQEMAYNLNRQWLS